VPDLVEEHLFAAVAGEAEHVEIGMAWALRRQCGDGARQRILGWSLAGKRRDGREDRRRERERGESEASEAARAVQACSGSMSAKRSARAWPPVALPVRGCG
jgi:hypothetical protein